MGESTHPAPDREPQDVSDDLLDLAWRAELARRVPGVSAEVIEEYCDFELHPSMRSDREKLRPILAAVLPAARKAVLAELLGTPEEIAAREAEAASKTPDDTVRLCEMARPGEHDRRVREQVAADMKRAAAGRRDYATRAPDHIAAELEGEARVFDTAAMVAADPREVMWGLLPASMWTDADRPEDS